MTTTDSSPVSSVVQTVEEQLTEIRARQNEILTQRDAEIAVPKTQLNAVYRPPTSEEILT